MCCRLRLHEGPKTQGWPIIVYLFISFDFEDYIVVGLSYNIDPSLLKSWSSFVIPSTNTTYNVYMQNSTRVDVSADG